MSIKPGELQLNDIVLWTECPVKNFETARVRGISPDGTQVLLGFIHHPVPISALKRCDDEKAVKFWSLYKPIVENQWEESLCESRR